MLHALLFLAGLPAAMAAGPVVDCRPGSPPVQEVRELAEGIVAADNARDLDQRIPQLMAAAHVPGMSLVVIQNGGIVWHGNFGVADAATGARVNDGTVFEAASLSKPVFAYAVLKLAARGVIDLDAPLARYLREPYVEDARASLITARMVLGHTTGFPNWRSGKTLTVHFTPGERFSYSGEGYVYLQEVVEAITGKPADDVVRAEVFGPLGMTSSSYVWTPAYDQTSAVGHAFDGAAVPKGKPSTANAAASLHTTALDYARFVVAVVNGTGLERAPAAQMLTSQVALDETCTNCLEARPKQLSPALSWGLGWGLEKTPSGEAFWHWGDNGAFRCFVMASRANRSGMVMFTNSVHGLALLDDVLELTVGGSHPASAWIKYDQYDSPAKQFVYAVARDGAEKAIGEFRAAAAGKPGTEKQSATGAGRPGLAGQPDSAPISEDALNSLGYQLLRTKRLDDAVRVFEWNVELYPRSWNVYDSLGEALMERGDIEAAIRNYRKSLELNPDNGGAVEKLKELTSRKR